MAVYKRANSNEQGAKQDTTILTLLPATCSLLFVLKLRIASNQREKLDSKIFLCYLLPALCYLIIKAPVIEKVFRPWAHHSNSARNIEGVDEQMRKGGRPNKCPSYEKSLQAVDRITAKGQSQSQSGNRQQATGNRQQATGNRQQATGNYTHLLTNRVNQLTAYIFSLTHSLGKMPSAFRNGFFIYQCKEIQMKKSNLWTGILAIMLVFGMAITACGGDDDGGGDNGGNNSGNNGNSDTGGWKNVANSTFENSSSSVIRAIAYGNGKFVAGGSSGKMATSTDGITWTAVTDSTFGTNIIRAIAYGGAAGQEKFVAGGRNGKMAYSADGVTWTSTESLFGGGDIYAIAYGNGKFVAVGTSGKMATSTDGATWTAVTQSVFTSFIRAIAYGNGTFVAVGDGKMATSTDGATWTAVTQSVFTSYIHSIAYGNGKFVAGGSDGKMATSTDGATWTAVGNSTFSTGGTDYIYAIAYGNGKFVAGNSKGQMATSTDDGATWTAVTDNKFGTTAINAIAYGNNKFIAVGGVPYNEMNGTMAYSADGATWTRTYSPYIFSINAIAYGGGKFVAGGTYGIITYLSDN